ncbi:MAG TPA: CcmD family protein [Actinobacteria bacterium]|nr:CcmD family protein [Actinomycetota bacterium]
MSYFVAAYFAAWLILFLYVFYIERKLSVLGKDLKHLKDIVKRKKS